MAPPRVEHRSPYASARAGTEALYRAVFAGSADAILVAIPGGPYLDANPAAELLTGYSRAEILAMRMGDFTGTASEPVRVRMAEIRQAGAITEHVEIRHRDGTRVPIEAHSAIVSLPGVPGGSVYVGIWRDISVQQRMEAGLAQERDLLQTLIDSLPDLIFFKDVDSRWIRVNQAVADLAGLASPADAVGKTDADVHAVALAAAVLADDRQVFATGEPIFNRLERLGGEDDTGRWLLTSKVPTRDEANQITGLVGISRDITDQVAITESLREAEAKYRTLVEQLPAVTYITSLAPDPVFEYVSPQLETLLGYRPEEWIGLSDVLIEHTHPDDRERILAADDRADESLDPFIEEYRMIARDGRVVWVNDSCVLVRNPDGVPLQWQGVMMDITARKTAEDELRRLAVTDPLTGLPNRVLFADRLARALKRSRHSGREIAVLFVDLDQFKHVNDSLGHAAGDRLLIEASRRLIDCCRDHHTLARFGGDEFALLIEGDEAETETEQVAERLIAVLRPPFSVDGGEAFVGGSVGVAFAEARHVDAGELLREADIALYEAKSTGRGRFAVFEPAMNERAVHRLEQEKALRRAVERDELEVRFQPVVDLETGVPHGCEALVRWRHPDQGILGPGEFLALAEETGLIVPVGEWVLETACRAAAEWPANAAGEAPFVAVNVSARQLRDPAFSTTLWRALAESGLAPHRLTLEVTEHALIEDAAATGEFLTTLRTLGVRLALDDFGTGYSSLGQLHRLQIDELKVDRSFVAGLNHDRHSVAIVRAVAELARELDLNVIAEGIETAEQSRLARELGCHDGQGYLFGPPLLPADVSEYLLGNRAKVVRLRRG